METLSILVSNKETSGSCKRVKGLLVHNPLPEENRKSERAWQDPQVLAKGNMNWVLTGEGQPSLGTYSSPCWIIKR